MEKIILKHKQLSAALDRLHEGLVYFDAFQKHEGKLDFIDQAALYRMLRDSLIQRFEFCVDLFWKYIKKYLEKEMREIPLGSPKTVIRAACNAKMITEDDTEKIFGMIKDRNMSSHIYKEEMANQIESRLKQHYTLMQKYTNSLSK